MSDPSAFYTVQYASAVNLLSQQMTSKIADTFMPVTGEGKGATVVDQVGQTEMEERTTRFAPINPANIPHTRPWVYPQFFEKAELFDTIDKLKMNADPTSQYVRALVAARNRKRDVVANAAFWATRNVGENGTTTEAFSALYQVGQSVGGTNSGLNVEKLQAALEIIKLADVDLDTETIYCRISPKQERNLMNEIEVISGDYTKGMVLESGRIKRFLGIEFEISNRLSVDGSGYRRVPVYLKSGMAFATWGATRTLVSQRNDLAGLPWQVYIDGNFGAVRVEQAKVVEVKCVEV